MAEGGRTPPAGLHPETLALTHGHDPAEAYGAAKPPAVLTSTYVYRSAQHAKDVHRAYFDDAGPLAGSEAADFIYSRLGHPNLSMVERRLAALDGAEDAAVFASGMAAISALMLAFVRPGDAVLYSRPGYGGTDGLLTGVLPDFGVRAFGLEDGLDAAAIRTAMDAAAEAGPLRLIHLETPANPTAAIVDVSLVARLAAEFGARQGLRPLISCDNTLLGPLLQAPLALGADLCVTSLTKYCGGHSDLLAGGISGDRERVGRLKQLRTSLGNMLDPFSSWLLLRSFETLPLRQKRACESAAVVADFLADHPKVEGVTYLGRLPEGSVARAVFDRQCRGAGSTFTVHLRGGEQEAFRLLDALRLLRVAVSLGGSETLICHSATTTHYAVPRERREAGGVFEGSLRLSIGLEHPDDLIADLRRGLEAV